VWRQTYGRLPRRWKSPPFGRRYQIILLGTTASARACYRRREHRLERGAERVLSADYYQRRRRTTVARVSHSVCSFDLSPCRRRRPPDVHEDGFHCSQWQIGGFSPRLTGTEWAPKSGASTKDRAISFRQPPRFNHHRSRVFFLSWPRSASVVNIEMTSTVDILQVAIALWSPPAFEYYSAISIPYIILWYAETKLTKINKRFNMVKYVVLSFFKSNNFVHLSSRKVSFILRHLPVWFKKSK